MDSNIQLNKIYQDPYYKNETLVLLNLISAHKAIYDPKDLFFKCEEHVNLIFYEISKELQKMLNKDYIGKFQKNKLAINI